MKKAVWLLFLVAILVFPYARAEADDDLSSLSTNQINILADLWQQTKTDMKGALNAHLAILEALDKSRVTRYELELSARICRIYYFLGDNQQEDWMGAKLYTRASIIDSDFYKARGKYCRGQAHRLMGKLSESYGYLNDAIALQLSLPESQPSGDPDLPNWLGNSYISLGNLLINVGIADEALEAYHKASKYFVPESYPGILISHNIIYVLNEMGQHEEAWQHVLAQKKIIEQIPYTQAKILVHTGSADTLVALGRYQEAASDYFKILELVKQQERRETYMIAYAGLADIYLESENVSEAKNYNAKLMSLVKITDNIEYTALPYINLAKIESLNGNLKLADEYIESGKILLEKSEGDRTIGLDLLDTYISIKEKRGLYKAAFNAQNKRVDLERKIKGEERQARLDILENRFQLSESRAEIIRKNSNINNLKAAKEVQQWISISITISAILVFTLIYSWYRRALVEKKVSDKANQAKSQFLATMSHELRTPINGVIGTVGLLKEQPLKKEQKALMDMIQYSGENLLAIVNDILDLSKIEAGKLSLENHDFELSSCVEGVFELFSYEIQRKEVELLYHFDDQTPEYIYSDSTRLRQVLVNLVGNALKFTEQGQVQVEVSSQRLANNQRRLTFKVSDTGIGMEKETLKRLFGAFEQADASITRKYGGTGLGLNISKRIVERMGGNIKVDSEAGKGTHFTFAIDVELAKSTLANGVQSFPDWQGKTIIIAVKNEFSRMMLESFCEKFGATCRVLTSVEAIIKQASMPADGNLMVLDSQFCHGSNLYLGDDKAFTIIKSKIPTVLLGNYQFLSEYQSVIEDSQLSSILKPIKRKDITEAINQGLKLSSDKVSSEPHQGKGELSKVYPLKIMVVEDNAVNQQVLRHILKKLGYRADIASDGLEGLQLAEKNHYDLILTDGQMPEMDGISMAKQICQTISDEPAIVLITGDFISEDYVASSEFIQDVLIKPVSLEKIRLLIEKWGKELVGIHKG